MKCRRFLNRFWALTFSLLLVGCQGQQIKPVAGGIAAIDHWQVQARIALRTPEDSVSASLKWLTQGEDFDFRVYGSFGVTYAYLTQKDQLATLKLRDDQTYYHQDAQQLLYQSLGWEFPIDALAYWLKGLPSGQVGETIERDTHGRLSHASLDLWQVEFSRYQAYSGYTLPKMIKATHPQMTLKLVVRDWDFLPQS